MVVFMLNKLAITKIKRLNSKQKSTSVRRATKGYLYFYQSLLSPNLYMLELCFPVDD